MNLITAAEADTKQQEEETRILSVEEKRAGNCSLGRRFTSSILEDDD
jgi:hypothetical protein